MIAVSGHVETQLVAHDNYVYDVAFTHHPSGSRDIFASVGDEGSVRQFDLRHLVQSTILYQEPSKRALVRLAWAKSQAHQLAFIAEDSNQVTVLDIRFTAEPLAQLRSHTGNVNAISWAPHSDSHLVSGGDDHQVSNQHDRIVQTKQPKSNTYQQPSNLIQDDVYVCCSVLFRFG